jgi:nicotinamidase-related amidase
VVLHAARAAIEAGYRVFVRVDACGGIATRTEAVTFHQIEAAGGVTTSVVAIVTSPASDFSSNPGQQAFQALQALRLG